MRDSGKESFDAFDPGTVVGADSEWTTNQVKVEVGLARAIVLRMADTPPPLGVC